MALVRIKNQVNGLVGSLLGTQRCHAGMLHYKGTLYVTNIFKKKHD